MDASSEFEVRLLQEQLVRQRVATVVVGLAALGALVWALVLGHAASQRGAKMRHLAAVVDSVDRVATAERSELSPIERQVGTFDLLGDRLRSALDAKAKRVDVRALGARLDSIDAQLAGNASALKALDEDVSKRAAALAAAERDSLASLRRAMEVQLAGLADTASVDHDHLLTLGEQVRAVRAAQRGSRRATAARDGATILSLALVTAHIIGDANR